MLQQVFARLEAQAGSVNRDIRPHRAALRVPALRTVADLNGCQLACYGEADPAAKAGAVVLGAHRFLHQGNEQAHCKVKLAKALQQAGSGCIQTGHVAALQAQFNVFGQHLAEFHTPLVKTVDAP